MPQENQQDDRTRSYVGLVAGTAVGHYRIIEKIGAGGMGEVYLAEDTELNRRVALKFLPTQLAADEDFKARFKREAQATATLKHPNVVTIYEVSEYQGRPFFAMEYIEGQSLRDRIKDRELPLEEVIDLSVQICEGLGRAHLAGIIHRDIKPSNICLSGDGRAKILDFGLAAIQGGEQLTRTGSTLGTIGYMSPEQAEGKEVDHRSDIFSFGVILYEMITGRRPFERDNQVATIQAIINSTPEPLARYKSNVPDDLQRIVSKLLAKDPAARYQHIDEVPVDLNAIDLKAPTVSRIELAPLQEPTESRSGRWRRVLPWSLVVLLMLAVLWSLTSTLPSPVRSVARLVITLPESAPLNVEAWGDELAVSPDGKRVVYVANLGVTTQLFLREIDRLETRALPGTNGAYAPFFSPDGQWVGFFAGGELKKLYLDGGKPISLCEAKNPLGGSWGADDTIFFNPATSGGLWKIAASGGEPVEVTIPAPEEFGHWSPEVLPGGEAVLFTIWNTTLNDARVAALIRKTGEWRTLITGGADARYVSTGHLLYAQSGTLVAAPFDLKRLEVGQPRVPVLEDVKENIGTGDVHLWFSQDGLLFYVRGGEWVARRRIVWVNRRGETEQLPFPPGAYSYPRLSPDGLRLAFTKFEGGAMQIWVHELTSKRTTQLTFESSNFNPHWTPDGARLIFLSYRMGPFNIFHIPVDRSSPEEPLLTGPYDQRPTSWSPDGRVLLYSVNDPTTGQDIWILSVDGKNNPQPLIRTSADEQGAVFHPSGNWIAYQSDESGRDEVFVRPFPGSGGITQISTGGGTNPLWSRDGRELFYRNGNKMMVVEIQTEPQFNAGLPKELFEGDYTEGYDVSSDGRFVMVKSEPDDISEDLIVVFNWFEELKRLVPTGK